LPGASLGQRSSCFCLPSRWNYRHAPPCPADYKLLNILEGLVLWDVRYKCFSISFFVLSILVTSSLCSAELCSQSCKGLITLWLWRNSPVSF
jgi:hypothetical protein